jgi:hypothetical protein
VRLVPRFPRFRVAGWQTRLMPNFVELRNGEVRRILLLLRTLVNRLQGDASP